MPPSAKPGKAWTDQEAAIRQTARYLGWTHPLFQPVDSSKPPLWRAVFKRTGAVISDELTSAITGALRTGELKRAPDGRLRAV